MVRLFTALWPPFSVRSYLASFKNRFPESDRLGWLPESKIHLTLNFLDRVAEPDLADLCQGIKESLVGFPPLRLTTGQVGAFPSLAKPRVIWIGVKGDSAKLVSLQRKIETALLSRRFTLRTGRRYFPHLTLARPTRLSIGKFGCRLNQVIRELAKLVDQQAFEIKKVTLVESHLKRGGARYEIIAEFPLTDYH